MRSCFGAVKKVSGAPSSTMTPPSMSTARSAAIAGEPDLVGDHHHGHAALRQVQHHLEHLADHLGIERRGRLVEQHHFRLERERAGDRDTLLLAAGELLGIGLLLVGRARPCASSRRASTIASVATDLAAP